MFFSTSLVRNDVSVLGSFDGGGFVVGLDCNIYNIPQDASGGFIEPNHDNLGHLGSSNNNSNNNGMDTISQQHFEEGGSVAEYLLSEMKKDRQERKTEKEERVKEREERVREREERVKEREERVREREEKGKDREEKAKEREERKEDRKVQREMMMEDRKMQREMMIMLMKKSG